METEGKVVRIHSERVLELPDPQRAAGAGRPLMTQKWEDVAFLHWSYDPDVVRRLLPPGLEVHTFNDRAWVGLVPFQMRQIAPAGFPSIPYFGTFPETNVRTYVLGPDGSPGVWFSSLESSRLLPVLAARALYDLPYFFASMHIERKGRTIRYGTLRRWPGPRGIGGQVIIEVGDPARPGDALNHFLTSRWRLFTHRKGQVVSAEVRHEPWPLHRAMAHSFDVSLIAAAGYPTPTGPPHVLYSPRVHVQAYPPKHHPSRARFERITTNLR